MICSFTQYANTVLKNLALIRLITFLKMKITASVLAQCEMERYSLRITHPNYYLFPGGRMKERYLTFPTVLRLLGALLQTSPTVVLSFEQAAVF